MAKYSLGLMVSNEQRNPPFNRSKIKGAGLKRGRETWPPWSVLTSSLAVIVLVVLEMKLFRHCGR